LLAAVSQGLILSSCLEVLITKFCTGSFILANESYAVQRRLPGVSNGSTLFIFSNELDLNDASSCGLGDMNVSNYRLDIMLCFRRLRSSWLFLHIVS
jgi:hypothetical protein